MTSPAASVRLYPREIVPYWSEREPDRLAVIDGDNVYSYGELAAMVAARTALLRQGGVESGQQVALSLPNSIEFVAWLFAVLHAGAIAATLDPALKDAERNSLLDDGEIDFIILGAGTPEAPGEPWRLLAEDSIRKPVLLLGRSAPRVKSLRLTADYVLHRCSSGSTGKPKHVLYTEDNVADDYHHLGAVVPFSGSDIFLGVTPYFHAFGGLGMFSALAAGATLVAVGRFMPAEIIKTLLRWKPTVFFATPAMLEFLAKCHLNEGDSEEVRTLRVCICATGKLDSAVGEKFRRRYTVNPMVLYGSSETLSATIDTGGSHIEGCVGKAMPGVRVAIFGESGERLDAGRVGRVGIASPSCVKDYAYGDQRLAKIGDYLLTGDKGRLDNDGNLYLSGRDDVINIGGYKVDRFEVENLIASLFPVSFVHVCHYDRAGQPSLRAIVETEAAVTPQDIIAACKARLVAYKVPSRVDILASLPRDANGKVKLASLQEAGIL